MFWFDLDLGYLTSLYIVETSVKVASNVKTCWAKGSHNRQDNITGDVTTDKTENRTGDVTTDKTENRTGDVTADKTDNRSGLTFRSQVWRSPRKRNRRADMKALKRMAGSTETQGPHVHAWRSEMHVWRVQNCGNCVLRTLCEWYALFFF